MKAGVMAWFYRVQCGRCLVERLEIDTDTAPLRPVEYATLAGWTLHPRWNWICPACTHSTGTPIPAVPTLSHSSFETREQINDIMRHHLADLVA